MHLTEHEGIPLIQADAPGPFIGVLAFKVGTRDETFRTAHVTHAVEHLACSAIPRSHVEHNALVTDDATCFYAVGRPDEVAAHLQTIANALANLPIDRLDHELRVLATETEDGGSLVGWSALIRFGHRGPAIESGLHAPVTQLRKQAVLDHARRFFTRGNAALAFSGPVPDGFSLDLPDGDRNEREPLGPSTMPTPSFMRIEIDHATLTYLTPHHPASWMLPAIVGDRAEQRLRHELGIIYSVDGSAIKLDDERLIVQSTDGRAEDDQRILDTFLAILRDLAQHGPTDDELEDQREPLRRDVERGRVEEEDLVNAAISLLNGGTVFDAVRLEAVEQVTKEDVRRWAQEALGTLLIALPEESEAVLVGFTDLEEHPVPQCPPMPGETFGRKFTALMAPRDLKVTVGDVGISLTANGDTVGGRWDQVVGVARSGGDRHVYTIDGLMIPLPKAHLKDAERLFRIVDEHAGDLLYDED